MMEGNMGDAVYYWAYLDMDLNVNGRSSLDFWSLCDSLNAGHCRYFCLNKLMIYYLFYLRKIIQCQLFVCYIKAIEDKVDSFVGG